MMRILIINVISYYTYRYYIINNNSVTVRCSVTYFMSYISRSIHYRNMLLVNLCTVCILRIYYIFNKYEKLIN